MHVHTFDGCWSSSSVCIVQDGCWSLLLVYVYCFYCFLPHVTGSNLASYLCLLPVYQCPQTRHVAAIPLFSSPHLTAYLCSFVLSKLVDSFLSHQCTRNASQSLHGTSYTIFFVSCLLAWYSLLV